MGSIPGVGCILPVVPTCVLPIAFPSGAWRELAVPCINAVSDTGVPVVADGAAGIGICTPIIPVTGLDGVGPGPIGTGLPSDSGGSCGPALPMEGAKATLALSVKRDMMLTSPPWELCHHAAGVAEVPLVGVVQEPWPR